MEKLLKIQSVVLSDGAITEQDTLKVTLVGCFNRLVIQKAPARHPGFFATVSVFGFELGESEIEVDFEVKAQSDDSLVFKMKAAVQLNIGIPKKKPSYGPEKMIFDLPIRIPPIAFPGGGIFELTVSGSKIELYRRHFIVDTSDKPEGTDA